MTRYLRYDALTDALRALAEAHPDLLALSSLGRSHEGRDLWLVTASATEAAGPCGRRPRAPDEKPALWIDANIHATELAPSAACLGFLEHLVERFRAGDPEVTRALTTRTFYVCPRVNPDGAELALADRPRLLRSSTRAWPLERGAGADDGRLHVEDIDGDGRVLSMRIADPDGPWKPCPHEPRLLVRRDPTETGATYYRLLPEGRIAGAFDGVTLRLQTSPQGLDLNRNFPAQWRVEAEQRGAGPYPASEPEVRAVVDFIAAHPNITAGIALHTTGGLLMRPFSHRPDSDFPTEDLRAFETLGRHGSRLTGYPALSVYHGFRDDPHEHLTGALDDWLFEHLGLFGWTIELWSPMREAGIAIPGHDVLGWYREHPLADDLALLRWSDALDGAGQSTGYVDWYPFEHPQLGAVELGGWHDLFTLRNPPPGPLLAAEIARLPPFFVFHALVAPELEVHEASATRVGEDLHRVRLVVQNRGWLPTSVTRHAADAGLVGGVIARLELAPDCALVAGALEVDLGQLAGRSTKPSVPLRGFDETDDRAKVEWLVRGPSGAMVELEARHARAGRLRCPLSLG